MGCPKLISAFHIVIVAPLLILIGLNKIPDQYKKWLVLLGVIIGVYHLINLCRLMRYGRGRRTEGMSVEDMSVEGEGIHTIMDTSNVENINGLNVHHMRIFDSSPGYEFPLIEIKQGDVIVWSNVGEVEHSVTHVDQLFNSGYMKPGERFSVRFTEKGTFDYYCMLNRGWMIGRVIVN